MKITDAIPHRPPFLLVDEIVGFEGQTIHTRRRVDPADPVLAGHFPGNPIMPGVLVCESIFQSGAILIARIMDGAMENEVPVLARIYGAKFKLPIRPGDLIDIEVHAKERLGNVFVMEGFAKVNDKTCVSIEFSCAAVSQESLK